MPRNSSTFSFRVLPIAALIAVIVVGAAEYFVCTRAPGFGLALPKNLTAYWSKLEYVNSRSKDESILVLGNSRSVALVPPFLSEKLFDAYVNEVFSLSTGAAMPTTQQHMLEALNYEIIRPGTTVLICMTPMCLNRNNTCFQRTLQNFYAPHDFFNDQLFHLRFDHYGLRIGSTNPFLPKFK